MVGTLIAVSLLWPSGPSMIFCYDRCAAVAAAVVRGLVVGRVVLLTSMIAIAASVVGAATDAEVTVGSTAEPVISVGSAGAGYGHQGGEQHQLKQHRHHLSTWIIW